MLFNLKEMGGRTLFVLSLFFKLLYIGLILIAPIFIIADKYSLFIKAEQVGKLYGMGLILAVSFAVFGLRGLKRQISKLPDFTHKQQVFKYTLELFYSLLIPFLMMYMVLMFKANFDKAYLTFKWCFWFVFFAICVDKMFVVYFDREIELRHKALEMREVNDRVSMLKK